MSELSILPGEGEKYSRVFYSLLGDHQREGRGKEGGQRLVLFVSPKAGEKKTFCITTVVDCF